MKTAQPFQVQPMGLNYLLHPTMLKHGESPNLSHFRFHEGILKKDLGWKDFADQADCATQLMWFDSLALTTGTIHTLAFTLEKSYQYNSSTNAWDSIVLAGPTDWTGDEDDVFSGVNFNDYYFACNGVDKLQKYSGTGVFTNVGQAGDAIFDTPGYIPKAMTTFYEYILMLHTVEGGVAKPQRIRWCNTDDAGETGNDAWNVTGTNAGYMDLDTEPDWIMNGGMYLGRLIIYKERSIYELIYVGAPDIFVAAPIVSGIGLATRRGLTSLGDRHVFLGQDDIYIFDGREAIPLGDSKLFDYLFGPSGVLNTNMITRSWVEFIEERNELWIGVPTSTDLPDTIIKYNFDTREFTKRDAAVTAVGFYSIDTALTWNDLDPAPQYAWENLPWSWDDRTIAIAAPTTLLGGAAGYVWEDDGVTTSDDGVEQEALYETKDFIFGESTRIPEFHFETAGNGTLYVSYSVDGGVTYSSEDSFTLTSAIITQKQELNVTVEKIRWKFRTSAVNFELKSFQPWVIIRKRRGT